MRKTLLWLDDLRNPEKYFSIEEYDIIWVHSYQEFVDFFKKENYMPDVIWFDHDLGSNEDGIVLENGCDCARFLVNWCIDTGIPMCPEYHSQSQNPVGKKNILAELDSYSKFLEYEKRK